MCFVKGLSVSVFCWAVGSLTQAVGAEAIVAGLSVSDPVALSDADMGLMLFLTVGLVALQLRREQKRGRRARLGGGPR
jgi:hypothetical protein